MLKNRVGEVFITNQGFSVKIVEYFSSLNCTIMFDDGNILKNIQYDNIKNGAVYNPFNRVVCNIGFLGVGKYKAYNKKTKKSYKSYRVWVNILKRCYSEKLRYKFPTYKDVEIFENWACFQNFAQWFEENYIEGFVLDKDILIKGSKVYSPETCCFVPQEMNKLFTKSNAKRGNLPIGVNYSKSRLKYVSQLNKNNKRTHLGYFDTPEEAFQAYKTAKESYIKEVADKWKDLIDPRVYEALYNYQVEITD